MSENVNGLVLRRQLNPGRQVDGVNNHLETYEGPDLKGSQTAVWELA